MSKYSNMVESIILIKNSKHFLSIDYMTEEEFLDMIEENYIEVLLEGDFLSMIRQFKLNMLFGDESELILEGIHQILDRKGDIIKKVKTNLELIDVKSTVNRINGENISNVKFKLLDYVIETI
jgi:hypothetical protein